MNISGKEAAVYLRKSRAEDGQDTDAILKRHRETLTEYAAARGIYIIEIYPEVASGESLYARPQMLRLLEDVETGKYDCVLCMDMDRLSRGSMRDQGIMLEAFKNSGTLIVTPEKIYDLSVETDEQYAELKTFISRQEYKAITKRLRRGLARTVKDGCYVANAPYGYKRVTIAGKPTLEIIENEACFVRLMYQLYADGYGCVSIARKINAMGAKPRRSAGFSRNSVKKILDNPVYAGKIVWNQKSHIKKNARGNQKYITIYNPKEKWIIVDGIHPPIIDGELWDKVRAISEKRYIPSKRDGTIKSSLAGLIRCEKCGGHMQRLTFTQGGSYLVCQRPGCCASAKYEFIENAILILLENMIDPPVKSAPERAQAPEERSKMLNAIRAELSAAEKAKTRLYDLVESGAYSAEEFKQRMGMIKEKISRLQEQKSESEKALKLESDANPDKRNKQTRQIQTILNLYRERDAAGRNALLKSMIDTIWYKKEKKSKPSDFSLRIVLKGH